MAFICRLASQATKFLEKTDKELYERLIKRIEKLKLDPFPSDVKRVTGRQEKVFRVRVGKYRIQYAVFYENNEILITDIDKRDSAYD